MHGPGFGGWNDGITKIFDKNLWDNKHLIISLHGVFTPPPPPATRQAVRSAEAKEQRKRQFHEIMNSMFPYLGLPLNLLFKRVIQMSFKSTKNTSAVEVCRRKHFLSGRAAVNSIHHVNTTKTQSLFLIFYKYQTVVDPFKIGLRRTARVVRYSTI